MIDPNRQHKTRDGRPVRIYATDGSQPWEVHGAIKTHRGWEDFKWDRNGKALVDRPHPHDLIEVTLADELRYQIPWEALRPEIRWVAMDDEGDWYGFTEDEPIRKSEGYWLRPGRGTVFRLSALSMPTVDLDQWQETLIERPEGR